MKKIKFIFFVLFILYSYIIPSELENLNYKFVNDEYIIELNFSDSVNYTYEEKTRGIHYQLKICDINISQKIIDKLQILPQKYLKNIEINYALNLKINFILESGTWTKIESVNKNKILKIYFRTAVDKEQLFLSEKKIRKLKNNNIKIIVIDPGHGGSDPGAVSSNNLKEKNLTLEYSIELYNLLNNDTSFYPILTRDTDYYLSLWDRNRIAQENQADMFISLHFNYHPDQRARGTNVYYYLDTAELDTETKFIANLENKTFFEHEKQFSIFFEEENDLNIIFWELRRAHTIKESARLTATLLTNLKKEKEIIVRDNLTYANFVVLKNLVVPSVLVEIGFLSNKEELEKIIDKSYKSKYIHTLYKAITNFF